MDANEAEIRQQLKDLKKCCTSEKDLGETAKQIVVDISEIIGSQRSPLKLDLYISLIFGPDGLITFCRSAGKYNCLIGAKENCLSLFNVLIENNSTIICKYAIDIQKLLRYLYNVEKGVALRCKSLELLCLLLLTYKKELDIASLNVSEFVEQIVLETDRGNSITLKSQQLRTLGVLSDILSAEVQNSSPLIQKVLIENLTRKSRDARQDLTIVAGALRGISYYLNKFNIPDMKTVYKIMHAYMDPNLNLARRDCQRAALELFHHHGSKFGEELMENYEYIYNSLEQWCDSRNRDDHKVALAAMDTFVVVIANTLEFAYRARSGKPTGQSSAAYSFLLRKYNNILDCGGSTNQLAMAVKGYGMLAGASKLFLGADAIQLMFRRILHIGHHTFFQSSEMLETRLTNLPSYVETLGIILNNIGESASVCPMETILQLCLGLTENFPSIFEKKRFLVYRALFTLMSALKSEPFYYKEFTHSFVYHTLIHSCSYAPPIEYDKEEGSSRGGNQEWAGMSDVVVTYKNYLPLWEVLLSTNPGKYQKSSGNFAQSKQTSADLYNDFVDCIIEIVDKIDLSIYKQDEPKESSEEDHFTSDPISGVMVKKPKDFQIYSNLASLSETLLPLRTKQLDSRLLKLFTNFVRRSSEQPLVSTHYSMMRNLLHAAKCCKYFDNNIIGEEKIALNLLTGYSLGTLERCKQFKDQLLAAALFLTFDLPTSIVEKIFPHLIPAVQMALRIGLSYLPIAQTCIEAMEHWIEILPKELIKEYYPSVLPLFMPYLRSKESYKGEISARVAEGKVALSKQRRKIDDRKFNKFNIKSKDSDMLRVQLSIWRLLGSLDYDISQTIISEECANKAVAWDSMKHVKFSIPFQDVKLDVYLDDILPNTIDLAVGSTDRQTKVAACELLHSLVILMIGTGSQRSEATQEKYPMATLYHYVFPAMFKLSCDSDSVTRQLFLTLTFQCIHWFTNNRTFENPDTAALLETIMNGLIEPNDPSLRDFSATSLLEFYKWSQKQSKDKGQELLNTKSILKRIISYCRQPCAFKRLGACLAWNSIYQEVRENETVCDIWTLELLDAMFDCFQHSADEDALLGTSDQCRQAIKHLERIIQKRRDLFSKTSSKRRLPDSCGEGTIDDVVTYLFERVVCLNAEARRLIMELLASLAPLCKGITSLKKFLEKVVQAKGKSYFIDLFEKEEHCNLDSLNPWNKDNQTYRLLVVYFQVLLCYIDCYDWIISLGILTVSDAMSYRLLWAIGDFTDNCANIKEEGQNGSSSLTANQLRKLDDHKSTIFIRILNFLQTALQDGPSVPLELREDGWIWTSNMFEMILTSIFAPCVIGFNVMDTKVKKHLPLQLQSFLVTFRSKIDRATFSRFQIMLYARTDFKKFDSNLPTKLTNDYYISNDVKLFVSGLVTVVQAKLIEPYVATHISKSILHWIAKCLYERKDDGCYFKREVAAKHMDLLCNYLQLAISADNQARMTILTMATSDCTLHVENGSKTTKGAFFLSCFGDYLVPIYLLNVNELMEHCRSVCKQNFAEVVHLVLIVLKVLLRAQDAREKYSNDVIISVMKCWPDLMSASSASSRNLKLLRDLLMTAFLVDRNGIIKQRMRASDSSETSVAVFYRQFLLSANMDLNEKLTALKLLPFFLSVDELSTSIVQQTLQKFRALYLPLRSTEYEVNSIKDREVNSVITEILAALELTANTDLLGLVVSIYCHEDEHRYMNKLQLSLEKMVTSATLTKQTKLLSYLYESCRPPLNQRQRLVEFILMPCLQFAFQSALLHFFCENIAKITLNIDGAISGRNEDQKTQLLDRLESFSLLQVMYCRLERDQVFGPRAEVNAAKYPEDATGKQLTKDLIRVALRLSKKELRAGRYNDELRRKLACAAYNALIAILSNVNDQPKLFEDMLFGEKIAMGEDLFDSVLDNDKVFSFDVEIDFKPNANNRLVAVHRKAASERSTDGDDVITYLASHNLDGSSLRTEASQFDFSSAVVLSHSPSTFAKTINQDAPISHVAAVKLDRSDFNDHEIMVNLTAVILQLMVKNSSTSPTQLSTEALPRWMQFLKAKLDRQQPRNVKLFVLRLLTNTEAAFQPFADHFIQPVLSCVKDLVAGNGINYFVVDILVMVISWGSVPESSCSPDIISKVLDFLISNAPHMRADIFKYNLNIIKCVVESWKENLSIPEDIILDLLEVKNGSKREVEAGIQISGILLANGLNPCRKDCPQMRLRFERSLIILLESHLSTIYVPSAEVIGLYINSLAGCTEDQKVFLDKIASKLEPLTVLQPGKFVTCVYFIQLRYAPIIKRFISRLLNLITNLFGVNLERAFECLSVYALEIENVSERLEEQNMQLLLTRKESNIQFGALNFVNAVLPLLTASEVKKYLPSIVSLHQHSSSKCREKMYHIIIYLYDNYLNGSDNVEKEIGNEAQKYLLRAVNDPDLVLRQYIINFWIKGAGTLLVKDRLLYVFEKMFHCDSEDCFLTLATNILLQASHLSTDFQRPIFEHALTECVFKEMRVSPGWKSRHASMAPLFTETQGISDVPMESLISLTQAGSSGEGLIGVQATQKSKLFSATQMETGENNNMNTYNWLTGSSLDVDMTDSQFVPPRTTTQSAGLLFSQPQSLGDMSRFKRTGLGKRNLASRDTTDGELRTDISDSMKSKLVRRRFVKNQDKLKQTVYFARQEEMRKRRRVAAEQDRKAKREAQVTIYRQYRVGELPDVQIPYKAVIAPLQALAERDSFTASFLFTILSQSVYEDASADQISDDDDWKDRIESSIQLMCKTSTMCVAHVVQPILSFCMCNDIYLTPQDITQLSNKSGMQPIGILVLEKQLLTADYNESLISRPNKKIKTAIRPADDAKTIWLCVADLYKSLSMYDCVLGIFKTEIGFIQEETKNALDAESTGNYYEAYNNYRKVLDDEASSEEEKNMVEEWCLSAAEHLGQWSYVEKLVDRKYAICESNRLRQLDEVWKSVRSRNVFVPTIVNSKLMRILRGGTDDASLCDFVNEARNRVDHRQYLETHLAYQLAVLAVNQEKVEEAKSLLVSSQIALLSSFANCSSLMSKSLTQQLTLARPLRELEDYLLLSNLDGADFREQATKTVARWKASSISFRNNSKSLQLMTFSRDLYFHFFLPKLPEYIKQSIKSARILNHVEFANAALDSGNPLLSWKHIEILKKISVGSPESFYMYILLTRASLDFSRQQKDPKMRLNNVITGCKFFDKIKTCTNLPDNMRCDILQCELYSEICLSIRTMGDCWRDQIEAVNYLKESFPHIDTISKEAWYTGLLRYSHETLIRLFTTATAKTLPNAYNSIAKFYEASMAEWSTYIDVNDFSKMYMECVLKSMAGGCQAAMYKFPRLLYLLEQNQGLPFGDIFLDLSQRVPVWMFLQWINHILIYINTPNGEVLYEVVQNIVNVYPQAIFYPFIVCKLGFDDTNLDAKAKQFYEKIEHILSNDIPLLGEFASAVSEAHLPHMEVRDSISAAFKVKSHSALVNEVRKLFAVFDDTSGGRSGPKIKSDIYASVSYMSECKKLLVEAVGANLSKLDRMPEADVKKLLQALESVVRGVDSRKLSNKLRNYSRWLANFKSSNYLKEIEVPGQYDGLSKPLPDYHAKISSFNENVHLLPSLRLPIKLTIYGTNSQKYTFLLKYGEDLRTDQRIEQSFALMNSIYTSSEHRLSCQPKLRTYSVVPLSLKTGLLQWVGGTQTLRGFMHDGASSVEKRQLEESLKMCLQANSYQVGTKITSRNVCVKAYEKCVAKINWDLLRKCINNMAVSLECFFHLRARFVSSYATLCISHWLMGIGDRHLDNFLVDLKTAEVIGIDFGHHFETSTQFLPIPELIPFRLTPQLVNVMKPLGTNGPYKEIMIKCLASLSQSKEIVLAVVEAFIKSPTQDWLNFILIQDSSLDDPSKITEFASQRLENIRKKLSGIHPSYITKWAASKNHSLVNYKMVEKFSDIILGTGHSERSKKSESHLSIAEQVEILIEQATDPNILGRTYGMWQPFI